MKLSRSRSSQDHTQRRATVACFALAAGLGCPGAADTQDSSSASETAAPGSESGSTGGTGDTEGTDDTEGTGETGDTTDPGDCWDDLAFGEHEVLYDGFAGGSEGVSFGADGLLYVSSNDRVWQLTAEGVATEFSAVPYALGLAARSDGGFVVASIGEINAADGAVYTVDANGVAAELATGIDSPNFVTIAGDGRALVSDDFDTRVFAVAADGQVEVVIADVPSPNGMAYSPDGARFYVASTFTAQGQLTRFEVDAGGLPIDGTGVEILQLGMGSTPDGIAVDADDRVYVAANLRGEIWRVDGAATELSPGALVAEGLGFPASLAFGRGPGFDPCSVYVTQLQGPLLQRVFVGVRGAALYD